jgi:hypothetical protein
MTTSASLPCMVCTVPTHFRRFAVLTSASGNTSRWMVIASAMTCLKGLMTRMSAADFLHDAACHACLFVSETTCERGNRFLDRRFVVPIDATFPALIP